jgi:hypothetical protein
MEEPEKNQYSHVCEAGENMLIGGGEGMLVTMGGERGKPVQCWKGRRSLRRKVA